ncbi:MAG: acetoacetate decarboxylase family protein [Candidatus Thorarchaeota archaeon]
MEKKHLSMPVHTPWYQGPLRFTDSEMIQVIFTPTKECYKRLLPKPLQPGLLGGAYLAHFRHSLWGEFRESAIVVQCTYKEHYGVYCITMHTDSIPSMVAHREIWGFPSKYAKFKYRRKENHIKAQVISNKVPLLKFDIKLEGPGDWIDTGDTINLKLIPGVDGVSYDMKHFTRSPLDFTIHEGMAGEGKLVFGHTEDDPLDDLFELENIIAGTWFRIDLTTNFGNILTEAEL